MKGKSKKNSSGFYSDDETCTDDEDIKLLCITWIKHHTPLYMTIKIINNNTIFNN